MSSPLQWDATSQMIVNGLKPLMDLLDSLGWIGHATHVVKLDAIDAALAPTAASLGMDLTLIKYTLSLFLAYPFAALMFAVPGKNLKHLISFLVGFVMVQWIFGPDWIHTFASSLGTYLICALLPRKISPRVAFVWAMGYMTLSHMYRMYVSYLSGIFDFTGTQMVLTMKLTSFAFNLYDGTYDKERVFKTYPDEDRKNQKIYGQRKKFAITALPNPLEFFGYIYCFTCILAGPAFEYRDYVDSIDGSVFAKPQKEGEKSSAKRPSTLLPGLARLAVGVVSMVGYLQLGARFKISDQYTPSFIAAHPNMLERWALFLVSMFAERLKYYFAWKVAEGASIMGGFGFEGYDKEGKEKGWGGVENIEIVPFELAPNIQTCSRVWNKRTQGWLERYTYQRTNNSLFATYFISALWHGLYPGFFIMFLTVPILTNIERLMRAKINPLIVPGYNPFKPETFPNTFAAKIYWAVCVFFTVNALNYCAMAFNMSSFERCHTALASYKYLGHVLAVALYVVLEIIPGPKKEKKDDKKKD